MSVDFNRIEDTFFPDVIPVRDLIKKGANRPYQC